MIPTFNRSATLRNCLQALAGEASHGIPFEVVIVDDGSTDSTEADVLRLREELPISIRYIRQSNRGPAIARNMGVDASSGELIIFLGDDIVVERGYLKQICGAYRARGGSNAVAVVGYTRYRPDLLTTPFAKWLENESGLQFSYPRDLRAAPIGFRLFYTSNVLVSKRAFNEAGGFAPKFTHAAFEDTELGYRLQSKGVELYFCPDARAVHVHSVSVASVVRRMRAVARAANELSQADPALFCLLYPGAERRFGRPSVVTRFVRWILAECLLPPLQVLDRTVHVAAPGWVYSAAIQAVHLRELASIWNRNAIAKELESAKR